MNLRSPQFTSEEVTLCDRLTPPVVYEDPQHRGQLGDVNVVETEMSHETDEAVFSPFESTRPRLTRTGGELRL